MNTPQEAHRRQFVSFSFYKLAPDWRRLPLNEREDQRREFAETLRKWNVPETMKVLTYSLVGLRADADMLLWRICYSLSCLQDMSADLLRTRMGGYLQTPYSFLGSTRRSMYHIGGEHMLHVEHKPVLRSGTGKYLFLYPLSRTRAWYGLPFEDRQRMMMEIVEIGHDFPQLRLHVAYSFGLDEQEFVVAMETDHPEQFGERLMKIREAEVGPYIMRDTPVFTCVQTSIDEMLERIG